MLTRKCDICGREIGMVNAHYQLIFDGGFIRKEKDICISCFNRIKDEMKKPQQADTPQTEEPQKDCKKCKNYDRCKNNRWKCCVYEPQTDYGWK